MTITSGDSFARFAVEKDKIIPNRVKPKLFEPRKDGTLSLQNIDSLSCVEIKDAGERVRESRKKEKLYGWAKIARKVIEGESLIVSIDNNPYCGHTTVSGWPEEKNAISDKQKNLATASCPVLL